MQPLPAGTLRTNVATWAVPGPLVPAVAYCLPHLAPTEAFDPTFRGQALETTYFDTLTLALRKARKAGQRYLTLRLRCYRAEGSPEVYALSAKTEGAKWRQEVTPDEADTLLAAPGSGLLAALLPGDLQARFLELVGDETLAACVRVGCRRYAVENDADRFTLDCGVATDTGKCLPFSVLEHKAADPGAGPPGQLTALPLRPIKLSKFLWATGV
jgi:hypothetical protein